MGWWWAAAVAEVAATGGGGLGGTVAVVDLVVVTGHLVVRETEICGVLRVLMCLGTFCGRTSVSVSLNVKCLGTFCGKFMS